MLMLYWLERTLTAVQVLAALAWLVAIAFVAGTVPFHGSGAATWDGWLFAVPSARVYLFAAIGSGGWFAASLGKKHVRKAQLTLVLRGE